MAETKVVAIDQSNISDDKDLPFDVIIEILSRSPVRALVRFTSVCKLWYSLIRSPKLINAHLDNHTAPSDYCIFQMPKILTRLQEHSYRLIRNDLSLNLGTIPVVYSDFDLSFIGNSCAGILCFTNRKVFYGRMIYLYNPSIKKLKLITHDSFIYKVNDSDRVQTRVGFGYCESLRDFKVVRFHYVLDMTKNSLKVQPPQVEIYSLNADCWRQCNAEIKWLVNSEPISFNGAIYWWALNIDCTKEFSCYTILSFYISTEEFDVIELPPALNLGICGPLLSNNGMLAIFSSGFETYADGLIRHELWVLEKCGNTRSWSKVYKCEAIAQKGIKAIGFTSNGKLLISMKNKGTIAYWDPKLDLLKYADSNTLLDQHVDTAFVESLTLFRENAENVSLAVPGTWPKAKGARLEVVKKQLEVLPNGMDIHKLKIHGDDVIVRIARDDLAVDCGVEEMKNVCGLKKPALVVVTGIHTKEKWTIQLTTRNYSMTVERCDGNVAPESLARFLANPEICFVMNTSNSLFKVFPIPMFANCYRGGTTLEHLIDVVRKKNGSVPIEAFEQNVVGRYEEGYLLKWEDLATITGEEAKECICLRYLYYKISYKLFCFLIHGEPLLEN